VGGHTDYITNNHISTFLASEAGISMGISSYPPWKIMAKSNELYCSTKLRITHNDNFENEN
jgi:hypothetical protein